jgi:hypothetical protein
VLPAIRRVLLEEFHYVTTPFAGGAWSLLKRVDANPRNDDFFFSGLRTKDQHDIHKEHDEMSRSLQ